MREPFDTLFAQAVQMFDGKESRLAAAAGVSQNAVWQAKRAGRVSPQLAMKIETATKGAVPKWKMRPDIWERPAETPDEARVA